VSEQSPAADLRQQVAEAFSHAASCYDTSGVAFFQPVAERLVSLAALRPGDYVLDAGCGTGACLWPAAGAVGPRGRVTGIDIAGPMLERAAAEAARRRLRNVDLRRGDAENPPFAADSVDVVLASNVLFVLADPERAARSYRRILLPGGEFASAWNIAEDPDWLPVIAAVDACVPGGTGFAGFVRRWPFSSVPDMEAMVSGCGFAAVTTTTEALDVRYDSPGQWWDASWSQAPRLFWQHIPEADRPAARAAASAALDALRARRGELTRRLTFGYTIARKPDDPAGTRAAISA